MRFKFPLLLASLIVIPMMAFNPVNAQSASLMPNYVYDISVVRNQSPEDNIFSIRLASTSSVTGCFEANPADIEKLSAGPVIYVKLEEGNIQLNDQPSYGQFGCKMNSGAAYTDIPFDKDAIIENGTNKIEIKSKKVGKLFDIKIKADDSKLTLTSELKTPVRLPASDKKKTMHYWFYPKNTIILSVPGMEQNPNDMKKLKTFAIGRGLTPMHETLDGFPIPKSGDKELFYVDNKKLLEDVQSNDKSMVVGSISKTEKFLGPQGPYDKAKKVSIFARSLSVND